MSEHKRALQNLGVLGEFSLKTIGEGTVLRNPQLCHIYGKGQIGKNCRIGSFVEIGPGVNIGENVIISSFCYIPEGVTIGNDVFIGPRVTFCNDRYPSSRGAWRNLHRTVVKDGAVLGGACVILPGIYIGQDAFVGAGSVVTKDVEDKTLVVGNPAQELKDRRKFR